MASWQNAQYKPTVLPSTFSFGNTSAAEASVTDQFASFGLGPSLEAVGPDARTRSRSSQQSEASGQRSFQFHAADKTADTEGLAAAFNAGIDLENRDCDFAGLSAAFRAGVNVSSSGFPQAQQAPRKPARGSRTASFACAGSRPATQASSSEFGLHTEQLQSRPLKPSNGPAHAAAKSTGFVFTARKDGSSSACPVAAANTARPQPSGTAGDPINLADEGDAQQPAHQSSHQYRFSTADAQPQSKSGAPAFVFAATRNSSGAQQGVSANKAPAAQSQQQATRRPASFVFSAGSTSAATSQPQRQQPPVPRNLRPRSVDMTGEQSGNAAFVAQADSSASSRPGQDGWQPAAAQAAPPADPQPAASAHSSKPPSFVFSAASRAAAGVPAQAGAKRPAASQPHPHGFHWVRPAMQQPAGKPVQAPASSGFGGQAADPTASKTAPVSGPSELPPGLSIPDHLAGEAVHLTH